MEKSPKLQDCIGEDGYPDLESYVIFGYDNRWWKAFCCFALIGGGGPDLATTFRGIISLLTMEDSTTFVGFIFLDAP